MDAASLTPRSTTHERLIHLVRVLPANGVALGSHHPGTQFVKHLERRLVAANAKLALELEGRLPRSLGCHEVRTPEPF